MEISFQFFFFLARSNSFFPRERGLIIVCKTQIYEYDHIYAKNHRNIRSNEFGLQHFVVIKIKIELTFEEKVNKF